MEISKTGYLPPSIQQSIVELGQAREPIQIDQLPVKDQLRKLEKSDQIVEATFSIVEEHPPLTSIDIYV